MLLLLMMMMMMMNRACHGDAQVDAGVDGRGDSGRPAPTLLGY
jgi:hypothetical protein